MWNDNIIFINRGSIFPPLFKGNEMTEKLNEQNDYNDIHDLDQRFIGRFNGVVDAVYYLWDNWRIPNCEDKINRFSDLPTDDLRIDFNVTLTTLCANYGVKCVEYDGEFWLFSSERADGTSSPLSSEDGLVERYGAEVVSAMEKKLRDEKKGETK